MTGKFLVGTHPILIQILEGTFQDASSYSISIRIRIETEFEDLIIIKN